MKISPAIGRSLLLLPMLLFAALCSTAQQPKLTVTGKVVSSETNTALSGASITIKGTQLGTTSDAAGSFSLKVDKGQSIVVGFVGFESKEYKINATRIFLYHLLQQRLLQKKLW
jgi:hypothetical protein